MSEPPKKIQKLTLNAFITARNISNRSRESDVSNQNVTCSTQSLSDFKIVRPVKNKQGESSSSLCSSKQVPASSQIAKKVSLG